MKNCENVLSFQIFFLSLPLEHRREPQRRCWCDIDGNISMDEEWNINGSYMFIEGITSPDGRVYGKMAHAERRGDGIAVNIYGEQDLKIFASGVSYFR